MTQPYALDTNAERREAAFERARSLASQHGLPSYSAWRAGLERRYTIMPTWYWNESKCRQNYNAHIQTTIEWQERQSRLNEAAHGLFESMFEQT